MRSHFFPKFFASAGENVQIYQGVKFNGVGRIKVGNCVWIGINNFLQASGGLSIGDHTIFGPDVKIWTITHRFDDLDKPISEQGFKYDSGSIGAHVWLASNVFVMPGVQIPDGCIVSAGAIVGVKKYPPYSIIAGNPARVIGYRKDEKLASEAAQQGIRLCPVLEEVLQLGEFSANRRAWESG